MVYPYAPPPPYWGGGISGGFGGMGEGWGSVDPNLFPSTDPPDPYMRPAPMSSLGGATNDPPNPLNPTTPGLGPTINPGEPDNPLGPVRDPNREPPPRPDIPVTPPPSLDGEVPSGMPDDPVVETPPPAPTPRQQVRPPTGIYDWYQAGHDRMLEDAQRDIEQSMAMAGFTGNRYGSAAMNQAAEQMRRHELGFQDAFTRMLYDQGQADLNRQLEAAQFQMSHQLGLQQLAQQGMLGQAGLNLQGERLYNDIMRQQIQQLFGMGQAETGRADMWNQAAMDEFMQNRFGYLPLLLGAYRPGSAVTQSPMTFPTGGGNEWMNYLNTALGIWGAMGYPGVGGR